MKLKFRQQQFQADAAKAVCDVFEGQPHLAPTYVIDKGIASNHQMSFTESTDSTGFGNHKIVSTLTDDKILENLQKVQNANHITPSKQLDGHYNLTIEMETGVGKTYTYIKTMYELNQRYGWSKFIIVVPSVAVREGAYKSFQVTEDHFAQEYGKKIHYFIYNSKQLYDIDHFAADNAISAMIINSQAFNARGKDARRIYMKLDEFHYRRPIDMLAKMNPIMIIDEPQSVEGKATKERLKEFNPLITLRYSATHKVDSLYNMVYRLDAMDAYNQKLVKKIAVKGISIVGNNATGGYLYLEGINLSKGNPTATIEFDIKGTKSVRTARRIVSEGYNLFKHSGELEEYKNGYIIVRIDGRDNSIELSNGIKLFAGDAIGTISETQLRRVQIRETILSHLEREQQLFNQGVKVLSLFFIDEVAKYKQYDDTNHAFNGEYATIFEEEYTHIVNELCQADESSTDEYLKYLNHITAQNTHAGYFSIDKNNKTGTVRFIESKIGDKKERTSDDADAYDLIMKNKERLLDQQEPVRFIFSHSALREGWDNPNVFQICTLKQSQSDVRKRQEVGRGLRLSVNQSGERMDASLLGDDVHNINVLTVIASESYDSFSKSLQNEIADAVADRFDDTSFDRDQIVQLENARKNNVELKVNQERLDSDQFQKLWSMIKSKSAYVVDFKEEALINKAVEALNQELNVTQLLLKVETGEMKNIDSRKRLQNGSAFTRDASAIYTANVAANFSVKYDLIGKIVAETGLMRKTVAHILTNIDKTVFEQFANNPEEFIIRAATIINEQKATAIIQHITYHKLNASYDTTIFTTATLRGQLGVNALKVNKHLYDYVIYDSLNEKQFVQNMDISKEVAVYVKLPTQFYINTPVGKYSPDWAIAFNDGVIKHIYFVAETKGSTSSMQQRVIEKAKIHCAKEHFKAISGDDIVYDVVDSYDALLNKACAHNS